MTKTPPPAPSQPHFALPGARARQSFLTARSAQDRKHLRPLAEPRCGNDDRCITGAPATNLYPSNAELLQLFGGVLVSAGLPRLLPGGRLAGGQVQPGERVPGLDIVPRRRLLQQLAAARGILRDALALEIHLAEAKLRP